MVNNVSIRIPLQRVSVPAMGEIGMKAILEAEIRLPSGRFKMLQFLVDTGSTITTIPIARAQGLGLVVPTRTYRMAIQSASGVIVQQRRPGRISLRIPGLGETVFDWPYHFVEYEIATPPISALGLAGLLNDLRLTFDGSYSLEARYGFLQIERYSSSD
jgi:hypothetical protein